MKIDKDIVILSNGSTEVITTDQYKIDNVGNVKNFRPHPNTKINCKKYLDKDGYHRVWIILDTGRRFIPVHRLVAATYLIREDIHHVVNHKNGIRTDNRIENLEWISPLENEQHARKVLGKKCVGVKASQTKLTEEQVINIRFLYDTGTSKKIITDTFDISTSQICRIVNLKNWSHLWTKQYKSNAKGQAFSNWTNLVFCKRT